MADSHLTCCTLCQIAQPLWVTTMTVGQACLHPAGPCKLQHGSVGASQATQGLPAMKPSESETSMLCTLCTKQAQDLCPAQAASAPETELASTATWLMLVPTCPK